MKFLVTLYLQVGERQSQKLNQASHLLQSPTIVNGIKSDPPETITVWI